MNEAKIDLRIIKTKKNIYSSFLELLENKSFEEIKVSEICSKAMINRSTFYAHFEDKYVLLDCLIKEMKDTLKKLLSENTEIENTKKYYMEVIKILIDHIEEKKRLYTTIVANNKNSIAMDMIYAAIEEDVSERIAKEKTDIPSEFVASFYIGAIVSVGLQWIRNKYNYPKEDVISYLETLILKEI